MLSALHEPKINKERLSNYTKYESTLDMTGINYPMETKQIPLFEKQNPTISISVQLNANGSVKYTEWYK